MRIKNRPLVENTEIRSTFTHKTNDWGDLSHVVYKKMFQNTYKNVAAGVRYER